MVTSLLIAMLETNSVTRATSGDTAGDTVQLIRSASRIMDLREDRLHPDLEGRGEELIKDMIKADIRQAELAVDVARSSREEEEGDMAVAGVANSDPFTPVRI